MRQSVLATKVRHESPEGEESKNAQLLIRSGFISKSMAGVYGFLPLGVRSLNKIMNIIREEINLIGGQEILLNGLQNPEIWKKTDRWSGNEEEVWFKSNLHAGGEIGFGWTHEEQITEEMKHHINSYRDLPKYVYQLQNKFRNEKRAKSGIMRTREFIMKDLYSFSKDEEEHKIFYEECAKAYMRIFERLGIGKNTFRTFASGGAFAEFSDEFQTTVSVGEDIAYLDRKKGIALNKEVYRDDVIEKLGLKKDELEEVSVSEVGNIFTLGTRFSEALGLMYADEGGQQRPAFMGSYGIGPARVLGVITELFSKDDSLILPTAVSPYTVHLIVIGKDEDINKNADKVYEDLKLKGVDVLYDDRKLNPGVKFADSDLIGIPHRLIMSSRSMEQGGVEYINRASEETKIVPIMNLNNIEFF